jgi:hypothetical protein
MKSFNRCRNSRILLEVLPDQIRVVFRTLVVHVKTGLTQLCFGLHLHRDSE